MKWRIFLLLPLFISLLHAADPGGVSGAQLWLRADQGIVSSPISQWDDQSSNGWNATQGTDSRQPQKQNNEANFNPVVRFDGSNDFLDVSNHSALNGKNLTVFVVTLFTGDDGYRSPWTTRDDPSFPGGHSTQGHLLYVRNQKYEYWNGSGSGSWKVGATGIPVTGNYEIATTRSNSSGTQIRKRFYFQGKNTYTSDKENFQQNASKPFRVGAGRTESANGDYFWEGDVAEVIVYDSALVNDDRKQIESYLAIKYGITLTQNKRYFDSNGTAVWAPSGDYKRDIAGLARDDTSALDQRVSHSINSDAVVTMSTNTDFASANSDSGRSQLGNDLSFLIWANNDGDNHWTATGAPADGKILGRTWRIRKTGTQNSVNIHVDVNNPVFDFDSFNGSLFFVHGTNLANATPMKMTDDGGGKWHIENITLADKEKFGFVIAQDPPVNQATMVINELLFRQASGHSGSENEEFVEFFVSQGGTLQDLLVSDQEGHQYTFANDTVSTGDYVVLYSGDGTNTTGMCSASNVHCYYRNSNTLWNDANDDVVLLAPSNTDTTTMDGDTLFYVPIDYIAYQRTSTSNKINGIPPTTQSPTIQWSGTISASGINRLQSLSLTPNGQDTDNANDWEITTSDTASGPITIDHNMDDVGGTEFICSDGYNNNAMPNMSITKTSIVTSDPVNGGSNPKRIPGATIRYCFSVINDGDGTAEDPEIKDTLTGNNRDKLTYTHPNAGKGSVVNNTDVCTALDCAALTDTSSSSYNNSTKEITISLDDIPANSHQCAYIDVTIQ
jgi:hypothetical protein